jgi:uncharacterized cofD-like protein
MSAPAVVAFGGGHGLAASLGALRLVTPQLTAVVTVADDGGSSGRLRNELDALPPGDLRMALTALAATDGRAALWADTFQLRFGGSGHLAGHAVGNLVLTGLAQQTRDPVAALDAAAELLGCCGRVLPLSPYPVDIVAQFAQAGGEWGSAGVVTVRGQVAVATTAGRLETIELVPRDPPACAEALNAVGAADFLVLGPGSLFTSVLPHLLVPEMAKAILASPARRVLVLNIAAQPGETDGFAPHTHLEELARLVPDLRLDAVIADPRVVADPTTLRQATGALGAELILAPVAVDGEPRHDPVALAEAFRVAFASPGHDTPIRN